MVAQWQASGLEQKGGVFGVISSANPLSCTFYPKEVPSQMGPRGPHLASELDCLAQQLGGSTACVRALLGWSTCPTDHREGQVWAFVIYPGQKFSITLKSWGPGPGLQSTSDSKDGDLLVFDFSCFSHRLSLFVLCCL